MHLNIKMLAELISYTGIYTVEKLFFIGSRRPLYLDNSFSIYELRNRNQRFLCYSLSCGDVLIHKNSSAPDVPSAEGTLALRSTWGPGGAGRKPERSEGPYGP